MQRVELADSMMASGCITFRGEQICKADVVEAVSEFLNADHAEFVDEVKHHAMEHKDMVVNTLAEHGVTNMYTFVNTSAAEETECCASANPYVPADVAPIVMVLDILAPGVGTIVAAYYDEAGCNCATVTCGIFQMLMATILVGWIWSICQGVAIYKKSLAYAESQQNGTPWPVVAPVEPVAPVVPAGNSTVSE